MPSPSSAPIPSVASASGTHAIASRWNPDRTPITKRDLQAAKLKAHIQKVVAMAPPLTTSQLAELSRLLTPGPGWSLVQHLDESEAQAASTNKRKPPPACELAGGSMI